MDMDKDKEYEIRHIHKGQGQGKDKGKATTYEQPFVMKKAKWQRIWAPTTTYEQPFVIFACFLADACSYVGLSRICAAIFFFLWKKTAHI